MAEHWYSRKELDNLNNYLRDEQINYHGVSGMDNSCILSGRQFGGCLILWHKSLNGTTTPLPCQSNRLCAIKLKNREILIFNVYMPCNADRNITVSDEFQCILSEISTICKMSNCDNMIIGGDLNLDLNSNSSVKNRLETFMMSESFACVTSYRSLIDYSFESKANNARSHIDHFLTSNCLLELTESYRIRMMETTCLIIIHCSSV